MSSLWVGCSSARHADVQPVAIDDGAVPVHVIGVKPASAQPKAVIYKTNGDYDDHVFVNLSPSRTRLTYYPDPIDVSEYSTPIKLGGGWLLDRRGGISKDSAFLDYTYDEYSHLKVVSSQAQLLAKVIPGASVTRMVVLPISASEAVADIDAVKKYIPKD